MSPKRELTEELAHWRDRIENNPKRMWISKPGGSLSTAIKKAIDLIKFYRSWDKQVRDFLRGIMEKPIEDHYETGHTVDECIGIQYRIERLVEALKDIEQQCDYCRPVASKALQTMEG